MSGSPKTLLTLSHPDPSSSSSIPSSSYSTSEGSSTSATYTSSQYQAGEHSRLSGRPVLTDAQRWRHACGAKDLRTPAAESTTTLRPRPQRLSRPNSFTGLLPRSASSPALDVVCPTPEFRPSHQHRHSGVQIRALNPPPDSDDIVDAFISEVLHVARVRRHTSSGSLSSSTLSLGLGLADPTLSPASVCTPLLTPSASTHASLSPLGTPFSNLELQASPFHLLSSSLSSSSSTTGSSSAGAGASGSGSTSNQGREFRGFTHPPVPDLKQPPRSRHTSAAGSVVSTPETIREESQSRSGSRSSDSPTPAPTPHAVPGSPASSLSSRPRTLPMARVLSNEGERRKKEERPMTLCEIVLAFGGSGAAAYPTVGIPTPVSSHPGTPVPEPAGPISVSRSL